MKKHLSNLSWQQLLLKNNLHAEGIWLIENAWQNHNYSSSEEKYILKKYGKYLSEEVHNLRLERLIWNKTWGSARRQLKRVDKDIRNFSNAKILLSRRKGNVDNAIKKINAQGQIIEHLNREEYIRLCTPAKSNIGMIKSYFEKNSEWNLNKFMLENQKYYDQYQALEPEVYLESK